MDVTQLSQQFGPGGENGAPSPRMRTSNVTHQRRKSWGPQQPAVSAALKCVKSDGTVDLEVLSARLGGEGGDAYAEPGLLAACVTQLRSGNVGAVVLATCLTRRPHCSESAEGRRGHCAARVGRLAGVSFAGNGRAVQGTLSLA